MPPLSPSLGRLRARARGACLWPGRLAPLPLAFVLALGACGEPRSAPQDGAPPLAAAPDGGADDGGAGAIDLEEARKAVADFVLAVTHQRKDELRRTFSFRTLARDFRPRRVYELSPTLFARFVEEAAARMLDPQGDVYQLLVGLTVGRARAEGAEVLVEGKGAEGKVTLRVGRRSSGALHVVRVE